MKYIELIDFKKMQIKNNLIYIILLIIFLTLIVLFFTWIPDSELDTDRPLYLLSTIIQSEAAILGIMISLAIIAVQISASYSSINILDLIRRMHFIWITLFIFIISILYGLWILYHFSIKSINSEFCAQQLSSYYHITIIIMSSVIIFYMIIWRILDPYYLMRIISNEIGLDELISYRKERVSINILMEMIKSYINRDNALLIDLGANIILNKLEYIKSMNFLCEEQQKAVSFNIIQNVSNLSKYSISKNNSFASNVFFDLLGTLSIIALDKKFQIILLELIRYFLDIWHFMINDRSNNLVNKINNMIICIGLNSIKQNMKECVYKTIDALQEMGDNAIEEGFEEIFIKIVQSLEKIAEESVTENKKYDKHILIYIRGLALKALKFKMDKGASFATLTIEKIIKLYEINNKIKEANNISSFIRDIGMSSALLDMNDTFCLCTRVLENLSSPSYTTNLDKIMLKEYIDDIYQVCADTKKSTYQ